MTDREHNEYSQEQPEFIPYPEEHSDEETDGVNREKGQGDENKELRNQKVENEHSDTIEESVVYWQKSGRISEDLDTTKKRWRRSSASARALILIFAK